ncbi:hypothetical protein CFC21_083268 [Triticum aestivum]|uniref:Pectate lyase n=2 Tax=Triticum aestivum TaxID=4565 RepID=A0A9R1I8D5_WHEAT|nr:hypothetical protein CFC21_083263 [Triticum aestivum]KAF7078925.1 hypothetical protein CFC21_083268 [Triticum aestivum]
MDRSLQWSRPASLLLLGAAFLAAAAAVTSANPAYNPDPYSVVDHFNRAVHRSTSPRRALSSDKSKKAKYTGPCMATNPIDRCWRCRKDWATDRQRMARCAKGFGRETTGGLKGKIYTVTDPNDDDFTNPRPGSLRWGVVQTEPLWIIFARDMVINASQEIIIQSDKTIDGRGAQVHVANGGGLTVQHQNNVIINNLHVHGIKHTDGGNVSMTATHSTIRTRADGDGVSIFNATKVWVDHLSMDNCEDGMVDVVAMSTAVTISNTHLAHHNDVMLFGADDKKPEDKVMQVTVAFNHFGRGLVQRMPRCRYGFFHVVNNDYTNWLMYAIGGSSAPTILSQGNRYRAPPNMAAKEVRPLLLTPHSIYGWTHRFKSNHQFKFKRARARIEWLEQVTKRDYAPESEWKNWVWISDGDLMINDAYFTTSGGQIGQKLNGKDLIKPKPGEYVRRLTRFAGPLDCNPGSPC